VESPFSRTDTKQSEAETGSYPPVEGFLSLASGHTEGMAKAEPAVSAGPGREAIRWSGRTVAGDPDLPEAEFAALVDDLRFVASLI